MPADPRAVRRHRHDGRPDERQRPAAVDRAAVRRCCATRSRDGVPVIGHCLGGQLLAQALGARVARTPVPEIGWIDVDVDATRGARARGSAAARASRRSSGTTTCSTLPAGRDARADQRVQSRTRATSIDDRHIGFQCHIEMTRELVETWCAQRRRRAAGASRRRRSSRATTSCATSTRALAALQRRRRRRLRALGRRALGAD